MKARHVAQGLGLSAILVSPALGQQQDLQTDRIDKDGRAITVFSPLRIDHRPIAKSYVTPLSFNATDFQTISSADRVHLLDFPIDRHTTLDLDLETFEVFAPDAVHVRGTPEGDVPATPGDITLLRGSVTGIPDSKVYLAISPNMNNGIIEIEGATYIISNGPFIENVGPHIYNMTDLPDGEINWLEYACTVIDPGLEIPPVAEMGDDPQQQPCRIVKVAIDTDNELANKFGTDVLIADEATRNYVETLVGAVSQIYIENFNMELEVVYTRTFPGGAGVNPDPWESNNTSDALVELRDLWESADPYQAERHGVHLLSGRPLGGGIAYLGAMCHDVYAMAVSANLNGIFPTPIVDNDPQNWDVVVTAHEWGHNLGAPHTHGLLPPHDSCGFGDCSQADAGTIMSYCHTCSPGMANIALTFAPRILEEGIVPYIANMSCDTIDRTGEGCNAFNCPADVNGDGELDPSDFTAWIIAYNAQDPAADVNRDGSIDPRDFTAWLISYQTGCEE